METGQKTFQTNSNLDKLRNNTLSIQVSLSGLSFCILNTETNTITHFSSHIFDKTLNPSDVLNALKNHLSQTKVLQEDFNTVNLIHENELSTLVPKPFFNEDFLADYLKFNSKILSNDYIAHDDLAQGDIVNVYVPYVNMNNFLYDTYGSFDFNHYSTILLKAIFSIHKNKVETTMYINISNKHFEIVTLKGNSLLLYNTFEYQTKEDFIYYILFTAEQLQLNPEEFPLVLIGNVSENDDLYSIAYTYIRHISIHKSDIRYNIETENKQTFNTNFILQNSF
ncbi:MAG: DUF3822 domain-containing protein [Bacteroidetes bacterium]|nr:MAG: DUF3822 domain-containing protein [Bacteroidota bacterium]